MTKQIALNVDKNTKRQRIVCRGLKSLGLELHKASGQDSAQKMLEKHHYRLILVNFDALRGVIFKFCSFVHSNSIGTILIAVVPETRLRIEERLFDCGVNDVVCGEHACTRLLVKRIRAHLNNCKPALLSDNAIRVKDTLIDLERREVWCNGTTRQLRGILADLLKYFIDNPNRIISREELKASPIWEDSICSSAQEGGKTFDVYVGKLRKIIEPEPSRPQIITSVRGAGWMLAADVIGSIP